MKREKQKKYTLREALKEHKRALAVYIILRGLVIVSIVLSILGRKFANLFMLNGRLNKEPCQFATGLLTNVLNLQKPQR